MSKIVAAKNVTPYKPSFFNELSKDLARNKVIYLLLVPVILYYFIFNYLPIYGVKIAFMNYSPIAGMDKSPWVGLANFKSFFDSIYFSRVVINTLLISIYNIIFGFPAPIIFALILNEIGNQKFKKTVQTISYLPHFVSTVVIAGLILNFTSTEGIITNLLTHIGFAKQNMLLNSSLFRTIYVGSDIWQGIGWASIIYIAALMGVNQELYEAVTIDGGGRWRKLWHISLPGIMPTVVVMFILRVGNMMNIGYEKIILLYNPAIYETADVISTFVYRKGLLEYNYSFGTAIGIFNSVINLVLLYSMNRLSRKYSENSLW